MTHLPSMLKLAGFSMAGTMVGAVLAQLTPHAQVSGDWTVDMRTVCAVGSVVFVGAWKISGWQKGVSDRLRAVERAMDRIPCIYPGGEQRCKNEATTEDL